MLRRALLLVTICAVISCRTTTTTDVKEDGQTGGDPQPSLKDFHDRFLVVNDTGTFAVFTLGETMTKIEGTTSLGSYVPTGRTVDGKFVVMTDQGRISIIDPATATVEITTQVAVERPGDIEVVSAADAYATTDAAAKIVRFNPTTGAISGTIDLQAFVIGEGKAVAKSLLKVGDLLFATVQRTKKNGRDDTGAVAVIDLATQSVTKAIDIEFPGTTPEQKVLGVNPEGALILDPTRHRTFISVKGYRPSNTGMTIALNLDTLTLEPNYKRADAGFQGPMMIDAASSKVFVGYHTSTPVSSTHLLPGHFDENGGIVLDHAPAVLNAFEELPDFPVNRARTLMAWPVRCPAGFCVGGVGISFVDLTSGIAFPRVSEAELGLKPYLVLFQ